ncbi:histidine phosphatase family protein [Porticoccus litoralis]|uniref:Histidine phosphatase family protein n=1 Tax=Porticoccus litoralis TaxID=434086 RepID=A0AAW8B6T7_9GAMM|nr:histidine phosphatase family protein [Porticoccus litoralis]MDP1521363.1 histidine phosphatase family protein [Porticoccus litoralis]
MLIYLLRHGDAPYDQVRGERALSQHGHDGTRAVLEQHLDDLQSLDLILCSPVLRARQTLSVVQETLSYQGDLLFEDVLRSEARLSAVEACVDKLRVPSLLLLSHQPLIGKMLEYLTDRPGLGWSMTTSSLACLDAIAFGRGAAELRWLTQP